MVGPFPTPSQACCRYPTTKRRVATFGQRLPAGSRGRTGGWPWGFRGFLGEAYEPTGLDEDRKTEPEPPPLRDLTQRSSIVNDAKRPGC